MFLNMKNNIFPLISKIILSEVLTFFYLIQSERLAVIFRNQYAILKCYIEKWIDVSELYKLTVLAETGVKQFNFEVNVCKLFLL